MFGGNTYPVPVRASVPQTGGSGGNQALYSQISYDTSSQDPVLVKSRVFVGNVSNQHVTREQLIDLYSQYGRIIGLTFFKGYAFIQYTNEADANVAVRSTNGIQYAGQQIDVKLAASQQKSTPKGKQSFGGGGGGGGGGSGGGKRELTNVVAEASQLRQTGGYLASTPAKMARIESTITTRNQANTVAAAADVTSLVELETKEFPDTMICGTCRTVFHDFIKYRDHRKEACILPSKPDDEPEKVYCFVCKEAFDHSWKLLGHLSAQHNLTVFAREGENGVSNTEASEKVAAAGDANKK